MEIHADSHSMKLLVIGVALDDHWPDFELKRKLGERETSDGVGATLIGGMSSINGEDSDDVCPVKDFKPLGLEALRLK